MTPPDLRRWFWGLGGASFLAAACGGGPAVPEHPTWADVQPILKAECGHCHGSTAAKTGNGYRLDFYDMIPAVCDEAAAAMPSGSLLAAGVAPAIATAITPGASGRPRMPPLPAPELYDWEQETLLRWARQPVKGTPPGENRPPTLQVVGLPSVVENHLRFTALVSDPDGDESVGVLRIAGQTFAMNRSGTFSGDLSAASMPAGVHRLTGVVCDGWTNAHYDLGPIEIKR